VNPDERKSSLKSTKPQQGRLKSLMKMLTIGLSMIQYIALVITSPVILVTSDTKVQLKNANI
jgi:hypothetical protein